MRANAGESGEVVMPMARMEERALRAEASEGAAGLDSMGGGWRLRQACHITVPLDALQLL